MRNIYAQFIQNYVMNRIIYICKHTLRFYTSLKKKFIEKYFCLIYFKINLPTYFR